MMLMLHGNFFVNKTAVSIWHQHMFFLLFLTGLLVSDLLAAPKLI